MIKNLFVFKHEGKELRSPWFDTLEEVNGWAKSQGLVGDGNEKRTFNLVSSKTDRMYSGFMVKGGEKLEVKGFPFEALVVEWLESMAGGAVRVFRSFPKYADAVGRGVENCVYVGWRPVERRIFREQKQGGTE